MWNIHKICLLVVTLLGCVPTQGQNTTTVPGNKDQCHLHTLDQDITSIIRSYIGKGITLIKYNITLHGDSQDILSSNMTNTLRPDIWFLSLTSKSRSQLLFGLRFDVLSAGTFAATMKELKVRAVDYPSGCIHQQTEQDLISILSWALIKDFTDEEGHSNDVSVCRRSVKVTESDFLTFPLSCCSPNKANTDLVCEAEVSNDWITTLQYALLLFKLFIFLFSPYYFIKLYYTKALGESQYIVPLKDKIRKTIMVKKIKMPADPSFKKEESNGDKPKRFQEFGDIVRTLPGDEIISAKFNKLQIIVDQKELMGPGDVPYGICSYIYQTLLRCKLSKKTSFVPCCQQSLFGSWSPYFLCIPLKKGSHDCNDNCKTVLPWEYVSRIIGSLLLMVLIPVPYYIRLFLYSQYESDYAESIGDISEKRDLRILPNHDFIIFLGPRHGLFITVYTVYFISFILLSLIRACNTSIFDKYIYEVVTDFRNISHKKSIAPLISHFLLPFEKFGLFCGFLIGCVYWLIALPICVIIVVIYNTPLLYLCGRLLLRARPAICKCLPIRQRRGMQPPDSISDGISSIESCCMLQQISATRDILQSHPSFTKAHICSLLRGTLIGSLCSLLLLSSALILAECTTYFSEILVITLIGTIVNAERLAKYAIIFLWIITYFFVAYTQFRLKYLKFSRDLFRFLQRKFCDELKFSSRYRKDGFGTCFKLHCKNRGGNCEATESRSVDSVEHVDGAMFWKLQGLTLYIDNKENARISKLLFQKLCYQPFIGSPGSVSSNILGALRRFVYSAFFAVLVFFGVMALREEYEKVSLQEVLVLLIAGVIPLVFLLVIPHRNRMHEFSFEGIACDVISSFEQSWPLYDLSFTVSHRGGAVGATPPGNIANPSSKTEASQSESDLHRTPSLNRRTLSDRSIGRFRAPFERESTESAIASEPTHIDLLLTVRDEGSDDQSGNIRSEPGSPGSRQFTSINQMTQTSSDRVALVENTETEYSSAAANSMNVGPLNAGFTAKSTSKHSVPQARGRTEGSLNSLGTSPDKDVRSDVRSIGAETNRSDSRSFGATSRHNTPPNALYATGVTGIMADCVVDLVGSCQTVTSLDNIHKALRKDEHVEMSALNQAQKKQRSKISSDDESV